MVVGERLKAARRMAGLSLRDLAKDVGVSPMAISKYERGLDIPSSGVLLRLARALDARIEYFFRPGSVTLRSSPQRRRVSLTRRQDGLILSRVEEWLERYLDIESLFGEPIRFNLPAGLNRTIALPDDVERAALDLRRFWHLGQGPIESVVEVLEDQGIKVGLVDAPEGFEAQTYWLEDVAPAMAVKDDLPGDRQRFSLACELGYVVLEPVEGVDIEAAVRRFAAAFLAPAPVVFFELGRQRHALDPYELHLLKHKYGLSMHRWTQRAKDLGVLPESTAAQLLHSFRRHGWHLQEPGDAIPRERPERMKRLIMRTLAEDLISESRAIELLGVPLAQFCREEAKLHDGFPVSLCS